jgi:uncharacterized membrane protein required for colicin V production
MMSNWGGLDYFIFLILVLNILLGMARGATKEIISTLCMCAALIATIKFTIPLTKFVNHSPLLRDVVTSIHVQNFMRAMELPPLTEDMLLHLGYCISLLICFTSIYCVCEAVLAYTNAVQVFRFPYALMDRKMGAAMGAMRGFVISLVFIMILEHIFVGEMPQSFFVRAFVVPTRKFDYLISQQAPERYKEILQDKSLYDAEAIMNQLQNPR